MKQLDSVEPNTVDIHFVAKYFGRNLKVPSPMKGTSVASRTCCWPWPSSHSICPVRWAKKKKEGQIGNSNPERDCVLMSLLFSPALPDAICVAIVSGSVSALDGRHCDVSQSWPQAPNFEVIGWRIVSISLSFQICGKRDNHTHVFNFYNFFLFHLSSPSIVVPVVLHDIASCLLDAAKTATQGIACIWYSDCLNLAIFMPSRIWYITWKQRPRTSASVCIWYGKFTPSHRWFLSVSSCLACASESLPAAASSILVLPVLNRCGQKTWKSLDWDERVTFLLSLSFFSVF